MTSAPIDGIKRSNVCGEGYRIEGALLKSYSYPTDDTYLPYENCSMTFQVRSATIARIGSTLFDRFLKTRPPHTHIRIHIVNMDLNDIHAGTYCLDSLRFYRTPFSHQEDRLVRSNQSEQSTLIYHHHCRVLAVDGMWQSE
jgi:hypothetical protein